MNLTMLKLSEYISTEEMKVLRLSSDLIGWYRVIFNLALVILPIVAVAIFPSIWVILVSTLLVGGRILGFAILNHDAGHETLFKTRRLNHWLGKWVLGALVLIDFDAYRDGHLKHHTFAGTENDPDKLFVKYYPVTFPSMTRKFLRDISGVNGFKELYYQYKVSTWSKRLPNLVIHSILLLGCIMIGSSASYLIFWAGYLFVYPLVARIRIMAEHGAVTDRLSNDPRLNTRTTLANPLQRLFIAPNNVNYHLEHHINPTVPAHNLRSMHHLLRQRGAYEDFDCIETGYWKVIKRCVSKTAKKHHKEHAASSVANMS